MTQLSYRQVVQLLAQNLGAKNTYNTVYAVAICFAESGGDTEAISPAGARGLWQIMPLHFGDGIIGWNNWNQPVANAREMWKLSGGEQNWAAWTTAYNTPNPPSYTGFVPAPQPGSPADMRVDQARAAVTQYFLNPPVGPSGPALTPDQQDEQALNNAFNAIRRYFSGEFQHQLANTLRFALRAERSVP
jgi:hypothetical protein